MVYAKVDEQGTVLDFPYRFDERLGTVPDDAVEVDVTTNLPSVSWDQVYDYVGVEKNGTEYMATFSVRDRYTNAADKLKGITTLKRVKSNQNEKSFAYLSNKLREKYTDIEIASWDQQRKEAEAYTSDNTVSTPLLSSIASSRSITVFELAEKVTIKSAEYDTAFGSLLGKYQKNRELLNTLDLEDETTWSNVDLVERL